MTRTGILLKTSAATVGIALTAFIDVPKKLVWNASASVPLGFYAITTADHLSVGDRVAIDPPEPLARYLAARGYLPRRQHQPARRYVFVDAGPKELDSGVAGHSKHQHGCSKAAHGNQTQLQVAAGSHQ